MNGTIKDVVLNIQTNLELAYNFYADFRGHHNGVVQAYINHAIDCLYDNRHTLRRELKPRTYKRLWQKVLRARRNLWE